MRCDVLCPPLAVGDPGADRPQRCHCADAHFPALVHLPPQFACGHLEYLSVSIVCVLFRVRAEQRKNICILIAFSSPVKYVPIIK